jgi:cell wall-associated NlpC family hydrolase
LEVGVMVSRRFACARIVAGTLSVLLLLTVLVPSLGFAAPALSNAAIEAKRREADAAQQKLDRLSTDLEMRYEELAQIEDSLAKTRSRIASTQADLEQASTDLGRSTAQLDGRAASIYRNGPVDILAVFVGAVDFQDFISRIDLMRRIGHSDASLVASVKDAKSRVETAKSALDAREAEQVALRDQARAKQTEYQNAFTEQKAYLSSLNGELKKLIAVERARQEKLAAERAAAAAAALRAKAGQNTAKNLPPFDPSQLGGTHAGAVAIAKKYLGVDYVWGGTSPSGFDCSGLVQYAYAQVGVSLPRTSREQFHVGVYIPPDRLDLLGPGDLVFFGYNGDAQQIHHVGMYVGGGDFIHAPQTGDVVRIASLAARIEQHGDYVGAIRP